MNFTTTLLLFSQLCFAVSTTSTIRGSGIDEQQIEQLEEQQQQLEEEGRHIEQQQLEQQLEEQRERELKESRIIGGTRAMDGEYPYAVSLQDEKGPYCGASLIAPDMLLTAAHCKQNKSIKAVIGRYDLRDTSVGDVVDVTAENQIRHAGYDPQTTDSDLMLIKLNRKTRATDTPYEDRVVRFGNYYISSDTPASVMGWGVTNPSGGLLPSTLMHAEVFTISNEECAASSGFIGNFQADYTDAITPNMLCTYSMLLIFDYCLNFAT